MKPILEVKNLTYIYSAGTPFEHKALDDISFSVERGEFIGIIGHTGSGKSTLLHMLGGLDRPTSGSVSVDGRDIFALKDEALTIFRRRKIGFVFQSYNLVPVLSVWENIVLPIQLDGRKVDRNYVEEVIATLGLEKKLANLPSQLSGGQQQRVAIARAIAARPPLILADEPTGNLDKKTGREILQIFRELHQAGNTIVLITHDPKVAQSAERVIRIEDGQLYENQEVPQDDLPVV